MPKERISTNSIADFQHILGYKFTKLELLHQALTHQSAINEKHPMAACHALSALAFVGDAVLKYAVARYVFLNGRIEIITSSFPLHMITQEVIPNKILADIAREKLPLKDYLIRGNGHLELSDDMYADCLKAIFGAIALDCGSDQQQPIFSVIERICSHRVEKWLVNTLTPRLLSAHDRSENNSSIADRMDWPDIEPQPTLWDRRRTSKPGERNWLNILLSTILIFIISCWIFSRIRQYHDF